MFGIVDGLLVKNVYDKAGDPMQVIAVPTSFRPRILYLLMRVQDVWVLRSAIP